MPRARRTIGLVAATWLICQVATLALVPTLLGMGAMEASVAECTCTHGAEATCPMHHKPSPSAKVCALQGMTTGSAALVNALFGVAGLLPASTLLTSQKPARTTARLDRSTAISRRISPDSPPPRS
jgi:hypothetical protein